MTSARAAALMVLYAGAASGQDPRPLLAPPEYTIQQWATKDGLPQSSVNAIAQDPDGHLWLGTFGGLVRFDGASFALIERTDSAGRHVDRVLSLAVDSGGALWIGTENGLLRRRGDEYDVYTIADGLPGMEVTALHLTAVGVLWIGTGSGGVARLEGDEIRIFRKVSGERIGRVESIGSDRAGTVWVNAANRFITIEGDAPSLAGWEAIAAPGVIHRVLEDGDGARWYSVVDGLVRVTDDGVRVYGAAEGVPEPSAMVRDPVGGYWLGTQNDGLFLFRPGAAESPVRRYALPDGRLQFRVRAAFVDLDGNVWIGTNANGLLRAKRKVFTTYASENGLSHDVITAVFQSSDGRHWIGTNCGGVNAIDPELRTVRVLNPRSPGDPEGDPCIFALAETPPGSIWQGTWGGGISLLAGDGSGGPAEVVGLPDSVILALFADNDGTLWVGTNSGGLAAVDRGRVRATYTTDDGLSHNTVRKVLRASNGDLWIATLAGLNRLRGDRLETPAAVAQLAGVHVRALREDADGDLWIGTYGQGVYRLHDDTLSAVTRSDGLADGVVSSILEDDRGYLWMSGNRGIQRVARAELVAFTDGAVDHIHAVLYGSGDGLSNAETNGGFQPAAWKDARGRLWFPTLEGVAVVEPDRIRIGGRPPPVTVDAVVVDGEPRPAGDLMELGPDRPNLEFRYTGLSLSAPEHVTYRYRLEGFDEDWVEAGGRRVAYYPRLEPGRYRFVVTAANRDGVWNTAGTSVPLRVTPPLWLVWWFRLAVVAGVLALGTAIARRHRAAVRRDREAKEEFARQLIESQEHERKRVAGELHDGLGQNLMIVRNRALLALRSDGTSEEVESQLRQITDIVSDSIQSVREIAHNLTPHELDHLGLSTALRAMAEALRDTSAIELEAMIEDVDDLLPLQQQINLYRIVQEGLSNVVRHSDASTATVRVRRTRSMIRTTIVDDGRGFRPPERHDGDVGFGLSGMAERARILNGRFHVSSEPGRGTRIELVVPVVPADEPGTGPGAEGAA